VQGLHLPISTHCFLIREQQLPHLPNPTQPHSPLLNPTRLQKARKIKSKDREIDPSLALYRDSCFDLEGKLTFKQGKRVFIKDIDAYLLPQSGKPSSIAPSLKRIKRGVGTNPLEEDTNSANGVHASGHTTAPANVVNGVNGITNGAHGVNGATNGAVNGVNGHATNGHETNGNGVHINGHNDAEVHVNGTNGSNGPYPYNTPKEPGNPTVMPREIQEKFHWAFLIRDPHHSIPSYYRCTIPPLDELTGFHNFDPKEAGYNELRRHFEYLVREGLVGPRVATRPDLSPEAGSEADRKTVHEICMIDADDMLDSPAPMIEEFCRTTGVPYTPAMLHWDTEEDYAFACENFEKWRGFHNDAIESKGLVARAHVSIFLLSSCRQKVYIHLICRMMWDG
jgi:hypothetical protein